MARPILEIEKKRNFRLTTLGQHAILPLTSTRPVFCHWHNRRPSTVSYIASGFVDVLTGKVGFFVRRGNVNLKETSF